MTPPSSDPPSHSTRVSLIGGLEYGMERWNGKWNAMANIARVTGTVLQG